MTDTVLQSNYKYMFQFRLKLRLNQHKVIKPNQTLLSLS